MYVSVRVVAGAKREEIKELPRGRLKISVKEPAKRNLANARVRELVAQRLRVSPERVRLISGHASPSKLFSISGEQED